jgi:hypothetical protein
MGPGTLRLETEKTPATKAGVLSIAIVAVGVWIFWYSTRVHTLVLFDDLRIYTEATARLLAGGDWYLPHQSEPYVIDHGDVLYPPVTAWFFAPWLVLPAWTFVAAPVAIVAAFVWSCRPSPWTWPIIATFAANPNTLLYIYYANPGLWIVAFVALGLRYQWPGALVLLKPSMALFALIGIRSRGWWLTVAGLAVLSLPVLSETLAYPQVILNSSSEAGWLYSLATVPMTLVPLAAWASVRWRLASDRRSHAEDVAAESGAHRGGLLGPGRRDEVERRAVRVARRLGLTRHDAGREVGGYGRGRPEPEVVGGVRALDDEPVGPAG